MLKKHMSTHFDSTLLECEICGLQFQFPEHLHQHSIIHTLQAPVGLAPPPPPPSAPQQQPQQPQQQPQQQQQQPPQQQQQPPPNNVTSSAANHHTPTHFGCNICEADFPNRESLQQHELSAHSSQGTGFRLNSCPECGEKFFLLGELKRHAHMHRLTLDGFDGFALPPNMTRTGKPKTFECPECHKFYSTYGNLKQHALTHDGTRPFECENCGKRFTTAGNLKQHRMKHLVDGKPHPCPVCGKRYSTAGNLKQHRMRHLKTRPFSCDLCGKSFSTAGILKQHAVVHTGIKMHRCMVCEKSFSSLGNLRQHELIHSRDHPTFSCLACNCWYTTAGNLKQHVAKKHGPNERLTSCPRCKRRYFILYDEGMPRIEDPNTNMWERICDTCNGSVNMNPNNVGPSLNDLSNNNLDPQKMMMQADVGQDNGPFKNPLCL